MSLIMAKNMVDFAELVKVPTPSPTFGTEGRHAGRITHQPIAHSFLVERVRHGLSEANFDILQEEHALARGGLRYFGGFAVQSPDTTAEDRQLVVGLRNSHDKGFAASLCMGNSMLVCENLCFSSTVKLARRHTQFIMRDIDAKIALGIGQLVDHFTDMSKRIAAYVGTEIDRPMAADLAYSLYACGALPGSKMPHVIAEWCEPQHEEFEGPTLWNLYNAVTEHLKSGDLSRLPERTMRLQGIFDGVADFKSSLIVDVEAEQVDSSEDGETVISVED